MPKRKTTDEFIKDVAKKHPTINVIGEYINDSIPILLSCNICGTKWEDKPHYVLHTSLGCPECNKKYVHVGENDFATKAPHLVQFFKNKSEASKITYMSHKAIELVCPICGVERTMSGFDLYRQGFHCQCCGDGVSYPNRLIRNVMNTFIPDKMKFEYQDIWTNGKLYDVYFEINNDKYVIEMDGAQHYTTCSGSSWVSYEDNQKNDKEKDTLAKENNVNMVRIDCKIARFSYIKKNIMASKLSELFDFSLIDWTDCDRKSQKSMIFDVCEYYNKFHCSIKEIANAFDLHNSTIRHYLIKGNELGLCSFKIRDTQRKPIRAYCISSGDSYDFQSIVDCSAYLTKVFGCNYFGNEIGKACKTGKPYKGFIFNQTSGIASSH